MIMEAQTGLTQLQGKEHQGMSTATKSWKRQGMDSPLECSETEQPCQELDFRLLVSKTVKEYIFIIFRQQVCGN